MRTLFVTISCCALLAACGGKAKSGKELAQEICDCSKKANAMDPADPKRATAQADCMKKQGESWNKIKDDQKKSDEFNATLSACATEQIRESFGK